jgi:hypothetical protein
VICFYALIVSDSLITRFPYNGQKIALKVGDGGSLIHSTPHI